jgi:hypothetical protein
MLMSDVSSCRIIALRNIERLGDEFHDGHACYAIQGVTDREEPVKLCIDQTRFLLLQMNFKRAACLVEGGR